jgi:Imidazolonepropionase and related amidohydrolases
MRKWNQEPTNLKVLAENKINFAITTDGLKSISAFHKNLQKAILYGFSKQDALAALTTVPAKIIGNTKVGNLNKGSYANFIITSGDVFDTKTIIYENWIQGDQNIITNMTDTDISGDYMLYVNSKNYTLSITGKGKKIKATVTNKANKKVKSKFSYTDDGWVSLILNEDTGYTRLLGKIVNASNLMQGTAYATDGTETNWSASKKVKKNNKKVAKKTLLKNL